MLYYGICVPYYHLISYVNNIHVSFGSKLLNVPGGGSLLLIMSKVEYTSLATYCRGPGSVIQYDKQTPPLLPKMNMPSNLFGILFRTFPAKKKLGV